MQSSKLRQRRPLDADVFQTFSLPPVVNCCGAYTDLGGSVFSSTVWQALEQLNGSYVSMTELMDKASDMIAGLVGSEAARVTPGASAAIALAVGATMTGADTNRWTQLPDTSGMKSEVVIAGSHLVKYKYAVCARIPGATLTAAGTHESFDLEALVAAIGGSTACVLVPAHLLDGCTGTTRLAELVAAAHDHSVPVVVDAAYLSYPIELLTQFAAIGADLTCFSAKYYGGPNSGGFVSGSRELIAAVAGLDFTRFETSPFRTFGRAFKMSRFDVAATALALREWVTMDHTARFLDYRAKINHILKAVPRLEGITAKPMQFTLDEQIVESDLPNCVVISVSPPSESYLSAIKASFADASPRIEAMVENSRVIIAVDALLPGQEDYVAARLAHGLMPA